MPRIQIVPNCSADETPTIDVCTSCKNFFEEDEAAPLYLQKHYPKSGIGSTEVAHPPYTGVGNSCHCCGDELTTADN